VNFSFDVDTIWTKCGQKQAAIETEELAMGRKKTRSKRFSKRIPYEKHQCPKCGQIMSTKGAYSIHRQRHYISDLEAALSFTEVRRIKKNLEPILDIIE